MNYKNINFDHIQCHKNLLKYLGKKLLIKTPPMTCLTGIEENYGKYQIKLGENQDFIDFMKKLEKNNQKYSKSETVYRYQVLGDSLILKVPYRYRRFEIKIESEQIYLPTIGDIKPGTKIEAIIEVPKVWNYFVENEDPYWTSGSLIEIREATIL